MAVKFINISRERFLKKYERVYRFTNLERFTDDLNSGKFSFKNPIEWPDPFEKFFLKRDYQIGSKKVNLPAKDNLFAVCLSGTLSSEAYWKVYAPKEDGIRLTINTEKFLNDFLEKIDNCDIYIGMAEYQITKKFYKIDFAEKLVKEIESKKIGEQQIRLLLKKRVSFLYEDEIRIILVPQGKPKDHKTFKVNSDIKKYISNYTLDPRFGHNHVKILKEYFIKHYGIKVSHSKLYADVPHGAIIL